MTVNQQQNGGQWNLLGTYTLDQTSQVSLSTAANGYVIADGIRLVPTAASNSPAGIFYVHNDHLGTPQVITDDNQTVVWKADYDPFGKATVTTEMVTNNVRFPGQYFDVETGLHYNYFRYYDPLTGRYVTSDPIGLDGGLNTYAYVDGNPLIYADPTGENVGRIVTIPVKLCIRFPRLCRQLVSCIRNPNSPKCKALCRKLRNSVHDICDKPGLSCKRGDSPGTLATKKKALQLCFLVRRAVTVICFRGRNDSGHRKQEQQVRDRIKKCDKCLN